MSRASRTDVYEVLKRDITHFAFKPGARLVEEVLSERYGVSRTPVREAMRRLEQEGLLVAGNGSGRVVREFDIGEFEDIYRVRAAIERLSAEQAAERASDDQIAELRGWLQQAVTGANYNQTDARFHMEIAALSSNALLVDSLAGINDRIWIIRTVDLLDDERVQIGHREHLAILDAIAARDVNAAGDRMAAHIDSAMPLLRELVSRALTQIYLGV